MKKKTVIVTGAAQGIGKCEVLELLDSNYNVAAFDTDKEALIELAKAAGKKRPSLLPLETDVSDEWSVIKGVKDTVKKYKGIYAVINNAGIGNNKPVTELKLSEWNKIIGVNLTSIFLLAKYAAPFIKKQKGCIINTASTRAMMSEKDTEGYSASKGGVVALTHSLAVSLGPDIRVNCISPGWIEVSDWKKKKDSKKPFHSDADKLQHPAGRVGEPKDIADMALYLLSAKAGFITGQNFVVDGGMTKKMIYV